MTFEPRFWQRRTRLTTVGLGALVGDGAALVAEVAATVVVITGRMGTDVAAVVGAAVVEGAWVVVGGRVVVGATVDVVVLVVVVVDVVVGVGNCPKMASVPTTTAI